MLMENEKKPPLVVLLGPTAVGKTALSVELADLIGGEIVSGDSMQFYRYLDIGTAKVRPGEMLAASGRLIPHHLLDICGPGENYSVADFQRDAGACIRDICRRGKIPLLVGGTGLYIQALLEGYELRPETAPDRELRARLEQLGREELVRLLAERDPGDRERLEQRGIRDERRIRRALEIAILTKENGESECNECCKPQKQPEPPYRAAVFGLMRERAELYRRIEQRVELMLAAGLAAETRRAYEAGYGEEEKPMQGLGYRQMGQFFNGLLTAAEAERLIKRDTRRFAKRQLTWWRRQNQAYAIQWFWPGETSQGEILSQMAARLKEAGITG